MTTINSVPMTQTQAPAFRGKKNLKDLMTKMLKHDVKLIDDTRFTSYKDLPVETKEKLREAYKNEVLSSFAPKKLSLSPEQAALERMNGMVAAQQIRNKEELENLIFNEAMAGHKDFLEGVNDALKKGAAKDIYKK